ncbi:CehA/McbA family metallohydrolase [Pseudokordiimonas caeni]|uniref:CehA/McbA family metallohydrolase n=1 Tax=Pseudokordiimonas caeni TaxID=2997908 RepID=UPI0028122002|nr:CehA/McbA family metallohydrolase [Pseudokordiimonas caeni]
MMIHILCRTLFMILACSLPVRAVDGLLQSLDLKGSITGEDHQSYVELPFEVPAGAERLTVSFSYSGREDRTTIDLGLVGPDGLVGWSGGNKASFTVAATDATPSYFAAPVKAGRWALLLGVPNIRGGVSSAYEARVDIYGAADAGLAFSVRDDSGAAGWYRGDLHSHSGHSDGSCASKAGKRVPCPVFRTFEAATAAGLDFFALSEHNTASHARALRDLGGYYDTLTLLPAREITTFYGHMNVFGTFAPLDFKLTNGGERIKALIDAAHKAGGLVSLNHPGLPSGEDCMGCGWVAKDTDFSKVDAIEVINGGTLRHTGGMVEHPRSGILFWEARLNEGHRMTAIGGSDNHDPDIAPGSPGAIAMPTTVVHAKGRDAAAILGGIRKGRVFVDASGMADSILDLALQVGGHTFVMGEVAPFTPSVTLSVTVKSASGGRIQIIENGTETKSASIDKNDLHTLSMDHVLGPDTTWVRANVRDAEGRLVLVGNPIYLAH